ncbi:hypothetical protein KQI88_11660 [Alkaliphilus sp. MSJ-5]|uniref:Streptomycin 6-kinase n=1 Tax=Alkaliphilus flagellatus TaxID=2841507 RepID=A0ABS6G3L2_9FIRM|nr:aminoglycoside phosphotransferase family protein [Alkaliphilus flagellatus]MBU5677067.1 hypothetical protein [Alkaliphilus flagellatus]
MISQFQDTVIDVYGKEGKKFLYRLPELLKSCASKWSLTEINEFDNLSYNYVARAISGTNQEVVLKIGIQSKEFLSEVEALKLYAGQGCVRLLDYDKNLGAMLLERLTPGSLLSTLKDDDQATLVAAKLMSRIKIKEPKEHKFKSLMYWAKDLENLRKHFGNGMEPFSEDLLERAEINYYYLVDSTEENMLLHGDLHHDNILSTNTSWKAIDPKGVVGDPVFEPVNYMRNYLLRTNNPKETLARRIHVFSKELGYDKQRLISWGVAHSVLSALWSYEDHGEIPKETLICARLFRDMEEGIC